MFSKVYWEEIMSCKQKYALISVIILLCLPLVASAQWLETTIAAGNSPIALVYNATNNKICCGNYGSDDVTVIDGATNSVITTASVGDDPLTLAYNPTNNKVYCANAGSNDVTVIDGAANSVIATITVGSWPRAFAWNPVQNRTYVANYNNSSISVIRDIVGIEEDTEIATPSARNDFVVYPTPTKTFFMIHSLVPVQCIRIYDALGNLVRTEDMTQYENRTTISVEHLSAGVYFVRLNTEDTECIRKVVVTE
jgi:YVTN family beta-propeller protein